VAGRQLSYVGVPFTRVVKRFVVQAGDVVNKDGTGACGQGGGGGRGARGALSLHKGLREEEGKKQRGLLLRVTLEAH
jgi:cyclophilin family peptidyl-prolyl cis-trans isomerase